MITEIKFTNCTQVAHPFPVAIFQRNRAESETAAPLAWRVIKRCLPDWSHPFSYSTELFCGLRDPHGNQSSQIYAPLGSSLRVVNGPAGRPTIVAHSATDDRAITIENQSTHQIDTIEMFRCERLIAMHRALAPGRNAVFDLDDTIELVPIYRAETGRVIDIRDFCGIQAAFPLVGFRHAQIIMTGGGPGSCATPLRFSMQNIRR